MKQLLIEGLLNIAYGNPKIGGNIRLSLKKCGFYSKVKIHNILNLNQSLLFDVIMATIKKISRQKLTLIDSGE